MTNATLLNVKQNSPASIVNVQPATVTANGEINATSGTLVLSGASAGLALTFGGDVLVEGQELLIVNTSADYSAELTLPSGTTWDGTNDKATFGTGGDALLVRAISPTRFFVIVNVGSVAFS